MQIFLNIINNLLAEYIQSVIKKGIGRTLFIRFFIIAIAPMAIVGIVSIQSGTSTIKNYRSDGLSAVAKAKHGHLMEYFTSAKINLRLQAELNSTVDFVEAMKLAYNSSSKSLKKFTTSYQLARLEDQYASDQADFMALYSYIDVLLLDEKGNVLYSRRKDDDMGRNLFNGKYSNTKFSIAAKKAIKKGVPVYSDMEFYPPYQDRVSSFLIQAVVDEYGDKIGLLAVHLSIDPITKIMKELAGYGETGETYLVGTDMLMRSNSRFEKQSTILRTEVDTLPVQRWLEEIKENDIETNHKITIDHIYKDYRNVATLGVKIPIELGGIKMLMLAEIDEQEAYLPAEKLTELVVYIAIIILIMVTITSIFSVRTITLPIIEITKWARELSVGSLMQRRIETPDNELGVLNLTFKNLVNSLQDVTWAMEAFSVGDLSKNLEPRSDNDVLVIAINQLSESMGSIVVQANEVAKGKYSREFSVRGERDELGRALANMTIALREATAVNERQEWLSSGQTNLAEIIRGEFELSELGDRVIDFLCHHLSAKIGVFYAVKQEDLLTAVGSYACNINAGIKKQVVFGEGLVGQCAKDEEIIIFDDVPDNYISIKTGIGSSKPRQIILVPLIYNRRVYGVIELGFIHSTTKNVMMFLKVTHESIAIVMSTVFSRERISESLLDVQSKSEEMQSQQEELKASNEELEEQTQLLRQSEEELKAVNEELEEKSKSLQVQKNAVEEKNREVEIKADELAAASQYKSEFLANMSHELRTPLNSLLILSKMLFDNKENNLNDKQLEWVRVISNSGTDLLELINDILDLSKVEAGKMTVDIETVNLDGLIQSIIDKFKPMTNEKKIELVVKNELIDVPELETDAQRLSQILKNLLSNAVKFTDKGRVTFRLYNPAESVVFSRSHLKHKNTIALSIEDTGIGIAKEKLEAIFTAFQQEDGSTSRKYGGTGLGLSISKELAHLLGGEITVKSEQNKGCEFILYLPYENNEQSNSDEAKDAGQKNLNEIKKSPSLKEGVKVKNEVQASLSSFIPDDRKKFSKQKKSVLIIEDNKGFATSLLELVRTEEYIGLVAGDGRSGIKMAEQYRPTAILLDIGLPDMSGEEVLSYVKNDVELRHIPVHIISGLERDNKYLQQGAVGYLEKPVDAKSIENMFNRIDEIVESEVKTILLVEDDKNTCEAITSLLENEYTKVITARDVDSASSILKKEPVDCLLLDLVLPDCDGVSFIKELKDMSIRDCPIIIHTGKDLSDAEFLELNTAVDSIILKGEHSADRLLDETMLFLHHVESKLPKSQKSVIKSLHDPEEIFKNKKILLVDDDMRNLFALSGLLADHGMEIIMAENGEDALLKLKETDNIDLILMDIMMPVMDGYDSMNEIRKNPSTMKIPIIALTAKAMPEDRMKCIDSGASDYLAKPIDSDKLLSLMRVWLHS